MSEDDEYLLGDLAFYASEALCRFKPEDVHSEEAFDAVADAIFAMPAIKAALEAQRQLELIVNFVDGAESLVMKAGRAA